MTTFDLFEKYLQSSYAFLNYRLRSEKEIRDNLKKKKAPEDIIERVVAQLRELRFVDDLVFARMWVDSRSRVKPRSQQVLKFELKQKGISPEIIEQVMQDDDTPVPTDKAMARQFVEKKIKKYIGLERQEVYQKLGGLLARKGFNWDTIKAAIDDALSSPS